MLKTLRRTFGFLASKNRRDARPASRTRRTAFLRLEALEDRLVPTGYGYTWTGNVSGSWTDAGNWTGGLPGGYPNSGDDSASLGNVGGGQTNAITYNGSGFLGELAATTGYTGTLTLANDLTVIKNFSWNRGTIDLGNSYTLEVDTGTANSWGGGQIGVSDPNGKLLVDGGSSLNVTSLLSSVTLGVPLVVQDASTVQVNTTVNFVSSIVVTATVSGNSSALNISGGTSLSPLYIGPGTQVNGDYIKSAGGSITFNGNSQISVGLWNTGATVQFYAGSAIEFTNASTSTNSRSYYQTGGTTILGSTGGTAGADVRVDQGFEMTAGEFDTYSTQTQNLRGGSTEAKGVYIHGTSEVVIGSDLGLGMFGTLYVDGWGIQLGEDTTVVIGVTTTDGASPDCDSILSNGKFWFNQVTNYTILSVRSIGSGDVTMWTPFASSSGGFSGQFATSTDYTQTVTAYGDQITKT